MKIKIFFLLIIFFTVKVKAQLPNISYSAGDKLLNVGTKISPININNSGGAVPNTYYGEVVNFFDTTNTNYWGGMVKDKLGNLYLAEYVIKTAGYVISKIDTNGNKSTYAGNGFQGSLDTIKEFATFRGSSGLAIDSIDNIYVVDNHKIRKISPQGYVSTFAGTGIVGSANGTLSEASFNNPKNIVIDKNGIFYVSDRGNNKIRKIFNGVVSTYAGSGTAGSIDAPTTTASFNSPQGIAIDNNGILYVADVGNHKIRKINTNGLVTTYAGNGYAGKFDTTLIISSFNNPVDVTFDEVGNLFVSDFGNNCIRVIEKNGYVKTIAGSTSGYVNGIGASAKFNGPNYLLIDTLKHSLLVIDNTSKIRQVSTLGYSISPSLPSGLVFENNGTISGTPLLSNSLKSYIVKAYNKWGNSSATLNIGVVSGNANLKSFSTNDNNGIFPTIHADTSNYYTYISDFGNPYKIIVFPEDSNALIEVKLNNDTFSKLAYGTNSPSFTMGLGAHKIYMKITSVDSIYTKTYILNVTKNKSPITSYPYTTEQENLVVGKKMTTIFPTNTGGLPEPIKVLIKDITLKTNDSTMNIPTFNTPTGLAFDRVGNLFVADQFNHKIKKIDTNGIVSTYAGTGEIGAIDDSANLATFNNPVDVAVDSIGNVFVTDIYNHKIRKISPLGIVTTLAGTGFVGNNDGLGNIAGFSYPKGLTCDNVGNVYVADQGNNSIRKINKNGLVTTVAGSGVAGFKDTLANYASFNSPSDLVLDSIGNIYVADKLNNRIRKILPNGTVTTHLGNGVSNTSINQNGKLISINKPENIVIDKTGNLYIVPNSSSYFTIILNSIANYSSYFLEEKGSYQKLNGIAMDKNEDFYFSNNGNEIQKTEKGFAYSINPELPLGLNLNKTTGEISGTPRDTFSLKSFKITSYNRLGSSYSTNINLACKINCRKAKLSKLTFKALDTITFNVLQSFYLTPKFNSDSFSIYSIIDSINSTYNKIFINAAAVCSASSIEIKINNSNYFTPKFDSSVGNAIALNKGLNTVLVKTTSYDSSSISIDSIGFFRAFSSKPVGHLALNQINNFKLYPNPFSDKINLVFDINKISFINVEINDAVGKNIFNQAFTSKIGINYFELKEFSNLKSGVYYLCIKNEEGVFNTIKLMKF